MKVGKPPLCSRLRCFIFWTMTAIPVYVGAGPIGYWPLDEGSGTSTADTTGNGNTGTLTNGATWTTGQIGNAVSFPNSNSIVSVNAAAGLSNLNTSGMTVSAWIKPNSAGGNGRGYIVGNGNGSNGWFLDMLTSSSIRFGVDTYPTAPTNRDSTASITLGAWQHVAATWDGSANGANIHLYVNGVLVDGASTVGSGTAQSDASLPYLCVAAGYVDNAAMMAPTHGRHRD
jgi:Concanavalin A-like lectin/glucanases superfamily